MSIPVDNIYKGRKSKEMVLRENRTDKTGRVTLVSSALHTEQLERKTAWPVYSEKPGIKRK
jgi:hypothetical protein